MAPGNHSDDGHALLPDHLPEVLAGVGQGALRCDVAPLMAAHSDLQGEDTHTASGSAAVTTNFGKKQWELTRRFLICTERVTLPVCCKLLDMVSKWPAFI